MSGTMPVLLGYQSVRVSSSSEANERSRVAIEEFAGREGFELAMVFTEYNGETRRLSRLLAKLRTEDVSAVAVACEADLVLTPRFRAYVRSAISGTGARLMVVEHEVLRSAAVARAAVRQARPGVAQGLGSRSDVQA